MKPAQIIIHTNSLKYAEYENYNCCLYIFYVHSKWGFPSWLFVKSFWGVLKDGSEMSQKVVKGDGWHILNSAVFKWKLNCLFDEILKVCQGNFFNGEIEGNVTMVAYGKIFPSVCPLGQLLEANSLACCSPPNRLCFHGDFNNLIFWTAFILHDIYQSQHYCPWNNQILHHFMKNLPNLKVSNFFPANQKCCYKGNPSNVICYLLPSAGTDPGSL